MKKVLLIIAGSILGLLIIIQFFQPKKNDNITNPQNDIMFAVDVPSAVRQKIVSACYDCHSEKTVYPFYNRFAPVSWLLAMDIRQAKKHMDFSAWATYDKKKQIKLLSDICDELKAHDMPLKRYVIMHSKAVINKDELAEICQWTETAAEQVMNPKK